jgi:hypothetical protein
MIFYREYASFMKLLKIYTAVLSEEGLCCGNILYILVKNLTKTIRTYDVYK